MCEPVFVPGKDKVRKIGPKAAMSHSSLPDTHPGAPVGAVRKTTGPRRPSSSYRCSNQE